MRPALKSLGSGIHGQVGRVVADFELFALSTMGLNPTRDFKFFYAWKLNNPANVRNIFGSTMVSLVPEIMWEESHEVFLPQ